MNPSLVNLTSNPESFFQILPKDWSDEIVPFWDRYKTSSKIFGIKLEEKIIGGGIIFSKVSPDTLAYAEEAQKLLSQGLLYIGFLWLNPTYRGQELGSWWIRQLKNEYSPTSFWLTIDEYGLSKFYERNNFEIYKGVSVENRTEWIMISK